MKRIILTLVLAISFCNIYAQYRPTTIATLQHNGTTRIFYRNTALQEALAASVSGDTICLSAGTFLAGNITHNVTIFGIGYRNQNIDNTWISGDFSIRIPSSDTISRLRIEGIGFYNTIYQDSVLHDPCIMRCFINNYYFRANAYFNGIFLNCRLKSYNTYQWMGNGANIQFINCYLDDINTNREAREEYRNCIIRYEGGGATYTYDRLLNSTLINCILIRCAGFAHLDHLQNGSMATNCVAINVDNNYFDACVGYGNRIASYQDVFKTYTGTYSDNETFELTDSARVTFLGNDSTEVGIYGGATPFTTVPSYPHISQLKAARTLNAEGKLNVEIVISDGE